MSPLSTLNHLSPYVVAGSHLSRQGIMRLHKHHGAGTVALSLPHLLSGLIQSTGATGFQLARRMREVVSGGAESLFYLLTYLMVLLGGLSILLQPAGLEGTVARSVRFILTWGIVAWILHDYVPLLHAINGGFDTLANVLLGGHDLALHHHLDLTPVDVASRAFLHAAAVLWEALPLRHLPALGWDLKKAAAILWVTLLGSVLVGVALVILLLAWLGFLGIYFMAEALTAIAVALGPLMIIFLLVPYLAEFAHGWFRFLVGAGFYKVVAAVTVALVVPVLTFALHQTQHMGEHTLLESHGPTAALVAPLSLLLYDCAVLLAVGFVLMLLRQVPSITQHLLSGRGSSGQGAWSSVGRLGLRATTWFVG